MHTAVKIAPGYEQPTVWVKDASRAVGVAQNLLSESGSRRADYIAEIAEEYDQVRTQHAGKRRKINWLSLDQARANKQKIDWNTYTPPRPAALDLPPTPTQQVPSPTQGEGQGEGGSSTDAEGRAMHGATAEGISSSPSPLEGEGRGEGTPIISHPTEDSVLLRFDDYPLAELRDYIDWTPFFHTWEMRGSYPKIFDDPEKGTEAKKLFDDAVAMLDQLINERWLRARGVVGIFPANQIGDDDIEVYDVHGSTSAAGDRTSGAARDGQKVITVLHHLRQQTEKPPGKPNNCLADYVAPKKSGKPDWIGAFAVTTGIGIEQKIAEFEADHDDYHAILLKALADRLAEAFAERLHERVRKEFWASNPDEQLDNDALIHEQYPGVRPAPGYPACPDHTEKALLWDLIDPKTNAGLQLTDSFAMYPAAAVSGWYFSHPESRYFAVGKVNRDQVEDYAQRKGLSLSEAERWLAPNLGYE